ncbi:Tetratricopeptide Repeat Protein 41-Like [Manis pentadactyla]|nr:Tetratricopeptide Repeat Protein 41-Like [Manis pentadactyla]
MAPFRRHPALAADIPRRWRQLYAWNYLPKRASSILPEYRALPSLWNSSTGEWGQRSVGAPWDPNLVWGAEER